MPDATLAPLGRRQAILGRKRFLLESDSHLPNHAPTRSGQTPAAFTANPFHPRNPRLTSPVRSLWEAGFQTKSRHAVKRDG